MSLTLNEQQVKNLAVGLQGAATCLLTAARTLTTNNSSLENEIGEQRDLNLLREFNSGDLRSFLLRYVETLVENDVIFKNYENINANLNNSSNSSSKGSRKDKNQQQNDTKDFVLEYFNSLIENDPLLKSFMKHDSKRSAVNNKFSSTIRSGKNKNKSNVNTLENDALLEIEELTKPIAASSSKHNSSKSNAVSNSSSSRSKANSSADTENGTKKKRNRIKKPVDPNAPKKPVSAFLLYQKDVQDEIRKEFPDTKWNDILRIISQRWQSLSNDDKKARQNYEIEYKTYMENKDNSSSNMIETTDDNKETASSSKIDEEDELSTKATNKLNRKSNTLENTISKSSKSQNNSGGSGTSKKRKEGMDDGDDKFKNHIKKSKKDKINFTNIGDGEEYGDDLAARKRSHIKIEGDEAVRPTIIVGNNRDPNNINDNLHKLSPNNKTKKKKPKDITTETRS
ncbi:12348_t:CDS:2 [Entrophospora sp. SA101]|nr:12348_t:CDS:2 [Entrophospora sp. SA101]